MPEGPAHDWTLRQPGRCAIQDDANSIIEKLMNAEGVVWATPGDGPHVDEAHSMGRTIA